MKIVVKGVGVLGESANEEQKDRDTSRIGRTRTTKNHTNLTEIREKERRSKFGRKRKQEPEVVDEIDSVEEHQKFVEEQIRLAAERKEKRAQNVTLSLLDQDNVPDTDSVEATEGSIANGVVEEAVTSETAAEQPRERDHRGAQERRVHSPIVDGTALIDFGGNMPKIGNGSERATGRDPEDRTARMPNTHKTLSSVISTHTKPNDSSEEDMTPYDSEECKPRGEQITVQKEQKSKKSSRVKKHNKKSGGKMKTTEMHEEGTRVLEVPEYGWGDYKFQFMTLGALSVAMAVAGYYFSMRLVPMLLGL